MTEEPVPSTPAEKVPVPVSVLEKDAYTGRITRTLIAVGAGCIAGIVCFYLNNVASASGAGESFLLPILIMLVAIILQKHLFMIIRINTSKLEKKDWFYQGFITFAFWYVAWTILLTETTIPA